MARPKKEGLDYFPVDVEFDEKVESILMIHKDHGLTWIIRFWQKAYKSMTGLADFRGLFAELFIAKCGITLQEHESILATALNVGFCYEMEKGVYTSHGIQKRIAVVSNERATAIERQERNPKKTKGKKTKEKESKVKDCLTYSANNEKNIIPPTLAMVEKYCKERKNGIDPVRFIDHYTERNWMPKGYTRRMTDWQAAVRTWEKFQNRTQESQQNLLKRLADEGKIPRKPL